jgi:hypothetical protein
MSEWAIELIRQVPNAAAVILMAYLFLKAEKEREERRVSNAKEMEAERRTHELNINNMWASYIKNIIDHQDDMSSALMKSISDHETASKERYEKMRITQELIDAVNAQREMKKEQASK